jgi:hypothetical protein
MSKHRAVALALVSAAAIACTGEIGPSTTTCTTDAAGNQLCAGYADGYPYDYAFVDPLSAGAGGYYPYTIDTVHVPPDYLTYDVRTSAIGPAPTADPPVVPEAIDQARASAEAINAGVRAALNPIRDLLRTAPAGEEEDTLTYGPMTVGGASYRFTMRRLAADRRFGWKLEVQSGGGDGAFALAAGGLIQVGDTPRRGRGTMGVDMDAMSAADPAVPGKGKLLIGFVHTGSGDGANDAKVLHVSLRGYTADPSAVAAMTAEVFAWRRGTSANQVRIVARANVATTVTAADEVIAIKLRWQRDVGARADAAATGGDIAAGEVLRATTCTDATLTLAACPPGLDAADPPNPDPAAADPPAGMPDMPATPTAVPAGL